MSKFPLLNIVEAKRLGICRVCRGKPTLLHKGDVFVLNCGKEYAHSSCLKRVKQLDEIK